MNNQLSSRFLLLALLAILSALSFPIPALSQGTAFTYQGRLNDANGPASGIYDLRFAIYDAASLGAQQGYLLTNSPTAVTNGLFTVTLDFGNQFNGASRWLEIAVRTNGSDTFATLAPRQALTPTPYALFAPKADHAALADAILAPNIVGTMALFQLPSSLLTNNAAGVVLGGVFGGNGAALTNVDAASLGGLTKASFWQTSGNSGTASGINFLGTTDNQELAFRANNTVGLRLLPGLGHPSVVGGDASNFAAPDCYNTFIGGGIGNWVSNATYYAAIGSGSGNRITKLASWWPDQAVIGGGINNTNAGYAAVIPGGEQNFAYGQYSFAAGLRAKAMHEGAFVWADTTAEVFNSTTNNQFLIRAAGGVGIGKNNPATALDVNGTITATGFSGNGNGLTNLSAATASSFTGLLAGDVTGTQGATVVATVGGQAAANVAGGASAANAATSGNIPNTIVKRDAAGNFLAGTIISTNFIGNGGGLTNLNAASLSAGTAAINITGNAATATTAGSATNLIGSVTAAQIPATIARLNGTNSFTGTNLFSGPLIATNSANQISGTFAGNGAGLTNLNTPSLAPASITADKFAPGALSSLGAPDGSPAIVVQVDTNGLVGIGTTHPQAALDVVGNVVVENATLFNVSASHVAMGTAVGAIGNYSTALGVATMASGYSSTAIGNGTTASGNDSTAMGNGTTASGLMSFASGSNTLASGYASVAMGTDTKATNDFTTAMGYQTTASGYSSTALGNYTTASSDYSTALGYGASASNRYATALGNFTTASGNSSTAMGHGSTASGNTATAMGNVTMASGNYSTAMGQSTSASGNSSTAMGIFAMASGGGSTAMGSNTKATNDCSTALGYNTTAGGPMAFAAGSNTLASGFASVAMGANSKATNDYSTALGNSTTASGYSSTALGDIATASGDFSTAMGNSTTASGNGSTAMGLLASASGSSSTAMGALTKASGDFSTALGFLTTASGLMSFASGSNTLASGFGSVAMGVNTKATNDFATALGFLTTASGIYSSALGFGSMASGNSSTAMGLASTASGDFSTALGSFSQATNSGSFVWSDDSVFFSGATSTANNSVTMRAAGGYRLFSNPGMTAGVSLASGGASWASISDVNAKKNFTSVNGEEVLAKLAAVPVQKWNYKWERDCDVPNIGPMAQAFKAAFYPGRDDKSITTLEFDGVELAAIQGLNQKLEQKETEIAELKARLDRLEKLLTAQH